MQETILLLRRQLDSVLSAKSSKNLQQNIDSKFTTSTTGLEKPLEANYRTKNGDAYEEMYVDQSTPTSVMSLNGIFSRDSRESRSDALMNSHLEQVNFCNFFAGAVLHAFHLHVFSLLIHVNHVHVTRVCILSQDAYLLA